MDQEKNVKDDFNNSAVLPAFLSHSAVYSTTISLSAGLFSMGMFMSAPAASAWWLAAAAISAVGAMEGAYSVYSNHCKEVKNWKNPLTVAAARKP